MRPLETLSRLEFDVARSRRRGRPVACSPAGSPRTRSAPSASSRPGPDYGASYAGTWPAELLDARGLALSHSWPTEPEIDRSQLRARVIGGCSAHNACAVYRGSPSDYEWGGDWSFAALRAVPRQGRGAARRAPVRRRGAGALGPGHAGGRPRGGDPARGRPERARRRRLRRHEPGQRARRDALERRVRLPRSRPAPGESDHRGRGCRRQRDRERPQGGRRRRPPARRTAPDRGRRRRPRLRRLRLAARPPAQRDRSRRRAAAPGARRGSRPPGRGGPDRPPGHRCVVGADRRVPCQHRGLRGRASLVHGAGDGESPVVRVRQGRLGHLPLPGLRARAASRAATRRAPRCSP